MSEQNADSVPTPADRGVDLLAALEASLIRAREDRSAGRWCRICDRYGSHHTDRHYLYEAQIDGSESA